MIDHHSIWGNSEYILSIIDKLELFLKEKALSTEIVTTPHNIKIIYKSEVHKGTIKITHPAPNKHFQYYQVGLERADIDVDDMSDSFTDLVRFIKNISSEFSPQEEYKLWEYTPNLLSIIKKEYFETQPLKDCVVIFREHSLISVYNLLQILEKLGLRPENAVYYSKGDRCKNIDRIEASIKRRGYGVHVLSPFEAYSPSGKTHDEVITEDAAARLKTELSPYFEKAKRENLKVIIFDDGGLMVTTVVDRFPEYHHLIYGLIESTKGGMHAIKSKSDIPLTIINLADCKIKNLMSYVIGRSIVHRLREIIPHFPLQGMSVVNVGYGALGEAIADSLRALGMVVYVCEVDDVNIYRAAADGYPVSKDAGLLFERVQPKLVLGCTGFDALNYQNLSKLRKDTFIATVSSNEIKQSYPDFEKECELEYIENYARIYTLPRGNKITILGNGASLNLFYGEGACHAEYQPFLAAVIESILYLAVKGPIRTKPGIDTDLANQIIEESRLLSKFIAESGMLVEDNLLKFPNE